MSLQAGPPQEPLYEASVAEPRLINVAMQQGYGPKAWRRILTLEVLPRIAAFKPDIILVSAGFDAHRLVRVGCVVYLRPSSSVLPR